MAKKSKKFNIEFQESESRFSKTKNRIIKKYPFLKDTFLTLKKFSAKIPFSKITVILLILLILTTGIYFNKYQNEKNENSNLNNKINQTEDELRQIKKSLHDLENELNKKNEAQSKSTISKSSYKEKEVELDKKNTLKDIIQGSDVEKYQYKELEKSITSPKGYCEYNVKYIEVKNLSNKWLEKQINKKLSEFFLPTKDEISQCDQETQERLKDGDWIDLKMKHHITHKPGRLDEKIISAYSFDVVSQFCENEGENGLHYCEAHPYKVSESLNLFTNALEPIVEENVFSAWDILNIYSYLNTNTDTVTTEDCAGIVRTDIYLNLTRSGNLFYLNEKGIVFINFCPAFVCHNCHYTIPYSVITFRSEDVSFFD